MSSLFQLLFAASVVCLIVGLVNPVVFSKWFGRNITKKRIAMIFGSVSVLFYLMTVAVAGPTTNQVLEKPANTQSTIEKKNPVIEIKEETKIEEISFETTSKDDSTLDKGQTKVQQEGKNGTKEIKYKVTFTDGKETAREKISETITAQPVGKVVLNGTKVKAAPVPAPTNTVPSQESIPAKETSSCDPNYSGACVPVASDVDCAGGSGNGPAYVGGPVYVIGRDIYELDRDGDGIACEK